MEARKVAVDYKGKHFIITDNDYVCDFEILDPYIDIAHVISCDETLTKHVEDCIYYGIPAYYGKDKELKKRINNIYKELRKKQ